MRTRPGKLAQITLLFSILSSLTTVAHGAVWYVDAAQGSSGNGTSWHEAFKTIQEAVPWAVGSDEIWVKRGLYPLSSTINLNMKMIKIYGGFAGGETELSQRDIKNNTTTIDGQNLHRVFYVYYGAPRIDGFTITRGKSGPSYNPYQYMGGAIYFDQCGDLVPVVINCVFKDNLAEKLGGAIANYSSSPYILNSSFTGNVAWHRGGAIFNTGTSMPFITNCTFANNQAVGSLGIEDPSSGGAIYSDPGAYPTITNSILWGNLSENSAANEIFGSNANNVTYSDVNQNGFAGTNGNIRQDPLLSGSGKLRLLPGSPCIDAGINNPLPYPLFQIVTDYFGNNRVIDGDSNGTATVDIGAHEYVPGEVVGAWYVNGSIPASGDGSSWSQAFKTIQEAVNAAASGNDIYVRTGVYGAVSVSKALNFYGGYEGVTAIDCQNTAYSNGFYINNTSVSISGFTITRAGESGIRSVNSSLTLTNTIFSANQGTGVSGGGIALINGGGATINNCTFTGNSAGFYGAALSAGGSITGPVAINSSTFASNHANHEGGAIYSGSASAPLTCSNCTFTSNSSDYLGGAIYSQSSLTFTNSTFAGNSATQGGGAVYSTGSSTITGCTFSGNSTGAYSSGGAILNQGGTHTVSNSRFLGNTAGEDGGGIASGNLTVLTSIFAGNRAINSDPYRGMGGGIRGGGAVQVINSTFYGNSANYAGGGMYLGEGAGSCSQFRVYNSILWGNTASQYKETGTAPGTGMWGCPDVYQYSNIDQNDYINYAHNIRQNPMFVNISGTDPSAWDFHLQAGSPSIDTGSNTVPGLPPFDIDGEPRIMDGSGDGGAIADMGVDEVTGPPDPNPPTGTIVINSGSPGTVSLDVSLSMNVTDPSGMSQMCISNTTSCTSWEAFTTSKNWTLTAGEGTKTVYGWFRDTLGNTNSAPVTGTIALDTTPPLVGTLTATPGIYKIQLTWSGFSDNGSGIASYRLLGDWAGYPSSCDNSYNLLYAGPNTSYLHDTSNTYYYRLCAQDGAGNLSTGVTATATPEQDLTPPTGSIVINNNATYTHSDIVTLTISATDPSGVTHMCISDTPSSCPSYLWEPFATSKSIYISGLGEQTVYIWFRDSYNNSNPTPFSDSIIADWQPPSDGTLTATPGSGTISLSWSGFSDAQSGLAGYKLVYDQSGNPYCDSSPVLYQGSDTSYIHTGLTNGAWYYYRVCATDIAGNESWGVMAWASPPISAPTALHITGYVNRGINLSWNANLNEVVEGYRIDYRPSWASWWNELYAGNVTTYTLTGLVGGETYVVRVRAYDSNYTVTDPSNEVSGVPGRGPDSLLDYNGDGRTDVAAFHLPSDQFFTDYAGNLGQYGWGIPGDCYPLIWDYDGNGATEVSVYHIPTNQWFVRGFPGDNLGQFGWGLDDSIPVPGDYNGDGIIERAFYHWPTNRWFIEGQDPIQFGWGGADCIPIAVDYDGDKTTDMMLYHVPTNQWFVYGVGNLGQFGWNGSECIPVPGDWDGDGRTEIGIYHWPSNQWFWRNEDGTTHFLGQYGWGGAQSFPIPGDYNSDGVMERGFYRPAENRWFIEGESDFVWGYGSADFMPISSQMAIYNWFRFGLGKFQ
jgi:predicted outer membrane repeat protein